ncbi:MAG: AAA-like domain-containing protein [Bacteroidia bacterium]|nr:AAA-like domain-containing protein [Bacteroidia bacterium]
MRYFNTSGPNISKHHYTLYRKKLIAKGMELVKNERYFTIWAPRQTGKSTYFSQLAEHLSKNGYKVAHINFESFKQTPEETFIRNLTGEMNKFWSTNFPESDISDLFYRIELQHDPKNVLIIDEVEGINPKYFGTFLHPIRKAYHSRQSHCLKSVILVGVSNIVGVVQDKASPFNIADNLDVTYFTKHEVYELLEQHEKETGQLFDKKVKEKIADITAGQPGLVNGFAWKLVENNPGKKKINYNDYLKAEDWYLTEAIDKNISNIINKANNNRKFVEELLFQDKDIKFRINRPAIKELYTNGIIRKDNKGNVQFWVPLYKKCLYDCFYPYENGETDHFFRKISLEEVVTADYKLNFDKLMEGYRNYVKRRSFKYFMEKDDAGNYKTIKEAALIYSFETFIQYILQEFDGKSYLEPHTGLGRSDLIINFHGYECVIETKIFRNILRINKGKAQLAYYCKTIGVKEGIYIVFVPNNVDYSKSPQKMTELINNIEIKTYMVEYDEEKDF